MLIATIPVHDKEKEEDTEVEGLDELAGFLNIE